MKTASLLGVALLAAFVTYCLSQAAAPRRARSPLPPRDFEPLPDRDGETEPTIASPAARTPGSVPPYHGGDPTVRH
jgi:hypothetical protein